MARISLDTMVTIVDSSSFIKDYASRVALAARPDLGEGGNLRPVVDLLVEQIECAPAAPCSWVCDMSLPPSVLEHSACSKICHRACLLSVAVWHCARAAGAQTLCC